MRIVFLYLLNCFLVACSIAPTAMPVAMPTSTASITPSPLSTETFLTSTTSLPTLLVKDAKARVKQLMKDNGGCSLPCWWGIIPGQTSWDDARAFLQSIDPTFDSAATPSHYSFAYQIDSPGYPISAEFDVDGLGIVKKISVSQTAFPFDLAEFLAMVGKPDRVFLQVYPFTTDGVPPFVVLLIYEDLHLVAQFVTGATLHDSNVVGCPDQSKPSLTLYAPSIEVAAELEQKFELERSEGSVPYRLLDESTKMDIDSFYQVFRNSNDANCIETPAEQWNVKQ